MVNFRRKPQAHACVVLSSRSTNDSDRFLSHETIAGWAQFTLPDGAVFSHAKITFKGLIKTTTAEDGPPGSISRDRRTEKLPFLAVLFDSSSRKPLHSDDGTVRVPFKFSLPECEKLASFVSSLPPSVDSRQEGQRHTDPQYEVSYNITATAYSKRNTLCEAVHKIFIGPTVEDSLSDTSSDTPGQSFWAQKGIARSKSVQPVSKGPRIELAGQEPAATVLNAEDVEADGSTEVPFIIKLMPQAGEKLDKRSFPTSAKVHGALIQKTSLSPDGIKGISSLISLDYIKVEGKITTKSAASHHQDHTVPIQRWERSISDTTDSFAVARFTFPFELHGGRLPTPTFYTPLVSRRYVINLSVSFDGADDTFSLAIPCDIVHTSAAASDIYDTKKSGCSIAVVERQPPMDRRLTAP